MQRINAKVNSPDLVNLSAWIMAQIGWTGEHLLAGFSYRCREQTSRDVQLVSVSFFLPCQGLFLLCVCSALIKFGHQNSRRVQGHKHITIKDMLGGEMNAAATSYTSLMWAWLN